MTGLRWWIHRNAATLLYLFILAIVAGLFAIAFIFGGGW